MTPPYNDKGEKPLSKRKLTFKLYFSRETVARDFTWLKNLHLEHPINGVTDLTFVIQHHTNSIYGLHSAFNRYDEACFRVMFLLETRKNITLKNIPPDLVPRKILQVKRVTIAPPFANLGITTFVYQLIVEQGLTLLSSFSQFDSGVGLWKKIGRQSSYRVRVLHDEDGYVCDDSGNQIVYNSSNLEDRKIWTSEYDFSGTHTLLILSK